MTGMQSLATTPPASPRCTARRLPESNIRLAQITQYARASSPASPLICRRALQQLGDVGIRQIS
ncbi:hypothetical protein M8494_09080 [Serratia ureilytica]